MRSITATSIAAPPGLNAPTMPHMSARSPAPERTPRTAPIAAEPHRPQAVVVLLQRAEAAVGVGDVEIPPRDFVQVVLFELPEADLARAGAPQFLGDRRRHAPHPARLGLGDEREPVR